MQYELLQHLKTFSFPLNVYAYVLAMEPEGLRYLHYGWFEDQSESIAVAQERSTRELLAWLPAPPARLLEVGAGIGTTLALLRERGYDACGITPDQAQIDFMRIMHGGDFPVSQVRFEETDTPPGTLDCILFQESSQYIALDQLFSRTAILLRPGGRVILCDEVLLGEPEPGEYLHSLAHLKSAAAGLGFSLVEERNLSSQAAPTTDFLLSATARHREDLLRLFDTSDEQIDALDESNRQYRRKYASGKYGYVVLCFAAAV